ncbi:MAG: nucleoside/nucleotide kinase family protein [Alphaproteobacteria bacterium]|nr:nucleoside/nucleotide kinase family protein [Alphaproteobacteria bacterium]
MPQSEKITALALKIMMLAEKSLKEKSDEKFIVAIFGAPAAGKSTFADLLHQALNKLNLYQTALLAMDGFHLDNHILEMRGQAIRKGAPFTFDVAGLKHCLHRIKNGKQGDETEIFVPVFDRDLDVARAGATCITGKDKIILVEGNYLMLNQPPWHELDQFFNLSIRLDVSLAELRERSMQRWLSYGLSPQQIRTKIEQNDMPNTHYVLENSKEPDIIFTS